MATRVTNADGTLLRFVVASADEGVEEPPREAEVSKELSRTSPVAFVHRETEGVAEHAEKSSRAVVVSWFPTGSEALEVRHGVWPRLAGGPDISTRVDGGGGAGSNRRAGLCVVGKMMTGASRSGRPPAAPSTGHVEEHCLRRVVLFASICDAYYFCLSPIILVCPSVNLQNNIGRIW